MSITFPTSIDTFPNPTSATTLGATGSLKHSEQHSNLNDSITAIETYIGVTNSDDSNSIIYKLDSLISLLTVSNAYCEMQYNTYFIVNKIWYTDVTKTNKILEIEYNNRNNLQQAQQVIYKIYSSDGITIKQTITDVFVYNGATEQTVTRTIIS
jgi:hypothetical protein